MALILNIDTSSKVCSVALANDGETIIGFESTNSMDHSKSLAPNVDKCLNYLIENNIKLQAISVSSGPGSYTGLRIGMSLAKGLAFGLDLPLITVPSLEIMAVRAIFTYPDFSGNEIIIPMIDARRMEVYTQAFDSCLKSVMKPQPIILDENFTKAIDGFSKILFIGDGTSKFKTIYHNNNAEWLGEGMPHVKYMTTLSEKYFRENQFSDVAYTVPEYLKDYQATQPKKKL